jgi:hypothetical protein
VWLAIRRALLDVLLLRVNTQVKIIVPNLTFRETPFHLESNILCGARAADNFSTG